MGRIWNQWNPFRLILIDPKYTNHDDARIRHRFTSDGSKIATAYDSGHRDRRTIRWDVFHLRID
jgi:hypothetical protein